MNIPEVEEVLRNIQFHQEWHGNDFEYYIRRQYDVNYPEGLEIYIDTHGGDVRRFESYLKSLDEWSAMSRAEFIAMIRKDFKL